MGQPVLQSRSPQIHQAAYGALGQPWTYELRETSPAELEDRLAELALTGPELLGVNLTLPLKQAAFDHVVETTPEALAIGAINCLRLGPGGWEGHNTDAEGWWDSVCAAWNLTDLQRRPTVLLGAGGACCSVLHVLRRQGAPSITVLARSRERAEPMLEPGERWMPWTPEALAEALQPGTLIVQTTGVGMVPNVDQIPLPWPDKLPSDLYASDLIYNPTPTRWLREAQARGIPTLDGCGMLVGQAARAIEWWSGLRPDREVMREALVASLP